MFNYKRLKKIREDKKKSRLDVIIDLRKINLNISESTLKNWEKGLTSPKSNDLSIISEYYGVDINHFFKF